MTSKQDYLRLVTSADQTAQDLQREGNTLDLKSDGGDGTSGGMEARLARLESDVDHIKRDIGDLKTDVRGGRGDVTSLRADLSTLRVEFGRLDERVKILPGKGFIVSTSVTIIGLLTGMIIFGDRLRTLLGVAG